MVNSPDTQVGQVLLRLHYQDLVRRGASLPSFADVEFKCFSQNGEDGILLYVFSLVSTVNRRVVEICAGDGLECNAANLIVNHGWQGLLLDGDPENAARGNAFYSTCPTTCVSPPTFVPAWITAEGVNALVSSHGFDGPIDLLSLDIDGNDYWIWKALESVKPRVVILEFNAACGPDRSVTMSYDPAYRLDYTSTPYRCGASLAAFAKLGREKGYRLVGAQSLGFNAVFVQNGVGEDLLPGLTPRECYDRVERLRHLTPAPDLIMSGQERWQEV